MRPIFTPATLVAAAAAACAVLVAPAGTANAEESAQQTITRLQQDGYTVNVDRVGSGSIQNCVVTSVRNPQVQTDFIKDYYGRRDENGDRKYRIIEVEVSRSISVSLDCT